MTSVITLTNKNGVAFAADSASTWTGESTTTRSATQKLFSLSGRQPIAFMVMGSAVFAPTGLTWDRIFYEYNKHFSEKNGVHGELGTVSDYESDFISFLNSRVDPVRNDESIYSDIISFLLSGSEFAKSPILWSLKQSSDENRSQEERIIENYTADPVQKKAWNLDEGIQRLLNDEHPWLLKSKKKGMEDKQTILHLEENHKEVIEHACEHVVRSVLDLESESDWGEEVSKGAYECSRKLAQVVYQFLEINGNNPWWKQSAARVTFGGFGAEDDYPTTIRLQTGSRLELPGEEGTQHVRVWDRNIIDPSHYPMAPERVGLNWSGCVFIESDAQSEFISRVTEGMDPGLYKIRSSDSVSTKTSELFEKWLDEEAFGAISQVGGVGEDKADEIVRHLKESKTGPSYFYRKMWEELHAAGNRMKREFRMGVLRLSPVELADLALTLVELQAKVYKAVKPHATVDLPVDACYLSKEHGFVWYRRKSLPDKQINPRIYSMHRDGSQLN